MKFVISPSKTMVKTTKEATSAPLLKDKQSTLLRALKNMEQGELKVLFGVSDSIAKTNYERFKHFHEAYPALFTYTGQQYKHKHLETLNAEDLAYLQDTLYIMSGLYGLLRPFDKIGHYRMPMGVKWQGAPLKEYWKQPISEQLEGETVINLASKEYSESIDRTRVFVIDVDFMVNKNGKRKRAGAMEAKKHRGNMVHFIAKHKPTTIETLKNYSFEGMTFQSFDGQVMVFEQQ